MLGCNEEDRRWRGGYKNELLALRNMKNIEVLQEKFASFTAAETTNISNMTDAKAITQR